MKKLKYHAYCMQCTQEGKQVVATKKSAGIYLNLRMCDEHDFLIVEAEAKHRRSDNDDHMSEGDYQSWGRL